MKRYNFDEFINRENTNCVKYDLRKNIFGNENVIPMWVADMDFRTPDFIIDSIKDRLEHEILGYSFRTEKWAGIQVDWLQKRFGWQVKPEHFIFVPGVVPAFTFAILAYTNPEDEIIVQSPVYFPFFNAIKDNNRNVVYNQLINTNGYYTMDLEDLERKITPRTKMIMLCSPHNPVGRVWTKTELEKLGEICEKHNLLILSDEIHSDLLMPGVIHTPTASVNNLANRTITCIAASKTFNIAGLSSSSVIITNPELYKTYHQLIENLHLGLGNVFGNIAVVAAYEHGENWLEQLKEYLWENYIFVKDYISANLPEITLSPLQATYLVWLDFRTIMPDAGNLKQFITEKAGLGLNEGVSFGPGGEGFMRINIACPRSVLEKALVNLSNSFKGK